MAVSAVPELMFARDRAAAPRRSRSRAKSKPEKRASATIASFKAEKKQEWTPEPRPSAPSHAFEDVGIAPPQSTGQLAPLSHEARVEFAAEPDPAKAPTEHSVFDNVLGTIQSLLPTIARVSKVISFTLKLRSDYPLIAEKLIDHAGNVRTFGANEALIAKVPSVIKAPLAERAGEFATKTTVSLAKAFRYPELLEFIAGKLTAIASEISAVATRVPDLEKLAVHLRTITGYLLLDPKTIARHWGARFKDVEATVKKDLEALVAEGIEKSATQKNFSAAAEVVAEKKPSKELAKKAADLLKTPLKELVTEALVAMKEWAKSILEAIISGLRGSLAGVRKALRASPAALAAAWSEIGVYFKNVHEFLGALGRLIEKQGVIEMTELGPVFVSVEKEWAEVIEQGTKIVNPLLKAAKSVTEKVAEKVADKAVERLETPIAKEVALAKAAKSDALRHAAMDAAFAAAERDLAEDAAEAAIKAEAKTAGGKVAGKTVARFIPLVNVGVALVSAGSTGWNAYKAFRRGDKRVGKIELAHVGTDLLGAIPVVGAGISLSGDVAAILAVSALERTGGTHALNTAEKATKWILEQDADKLREIQYDERFRLLMFIIQDARTIEGARAFRRLYYAANDVDGPRLHEILGKEIGSSTDEWLSKVRQVLDGVPIPL